MAFYEYIAREVAPEALTSTEVELPAELEVIDVLNQALLQEEKTKLDNLFDASQYGGNPLHDANLNPQDDATPFLMACKAFLSRLPYVRGDLIDWTATRANLPRVIIAGDHQIPADRVINVRSFENWTGLGEPLGSKRIFTPDNYGFGPGTLNAIATYALLDRATQPKNDGSVMVVAKDADGEYWSILDCDGSHRAGAQKLRGDATIQVAKTKIYDDESMPKIQIGVRESFSKRS